MNIVNVSLWRSYSISMPYDIPVFPLRNVQGKRKAQNGVFQTGNLTPNLTLPRQKTPLFEASQ